MTTIAYRIDITTDNEDALRRLGPPEDLVPWIRETIGDGLGAAFAGETPINVTQLDTRWHDDSCATLCSGVNCNNDHACMVCAETT